MGVWGRGEASWLKCRLLAPPGPAGDCLGWDLAACISQGCAGGAAVAGEGSWAGPGPAGRPSLWRPVLPAHFPVAAALGGVGCLMQGRGPDEPLG